MSERRYISIQEFRNDLIADSNAGLMADPNCVRWVASPEYQEFDDGLLKKWMGWFSPELKFRSDCFGNTIRQEWVEASKQRASLVAKNLLREDLDPVSNDIMGEYNATDYYFQNILGPSRTVLDFGCGFGRQSLLWTAVQDNVNLISVEGISGPYLVQNRVYQQYDDVELNEYIGNSRNFKFDLESPGKRINHIPSWRLDLIPNHSVDLIVCVQVLDELHGEYFRYLLPHFSRILKTTGKLFIRDHETHFLRQISVTATLKGNGWREVYRYPGDDRLRRADRLPSNQTIMGVPRLLQFIGKNRFQIVQDEINATQPR